MSPHSIRGCCPHCGANTSHAFLPVAATSAAGIALHTNADDAFGLSAEQRFVCTACEQSWEAAIVPTAQLARLREAATALDEAKRQIAMLRLIMSKDQIERAQRSHEDVIRLRRAA